MRCCLLVLFLLLFKSESVLSQNIDSLNHPLIFIYTDKAPVINTKSGDIFSLEGKYSQVNLNFASQSINNYKIPTSKAFNNDSTVIDSIYRKILTTKDTFGLDQVADYYLAKTNHNSNENFKQDIRYIDCLHKLFLELEFEDHLFWLHTLYASIYRSQSLNEAASIEAAKADSIEKKARNKNTSFFGRGYYNLANYYYSLGDYPSARRLNALALSIAEKKSAPMEIIVARIYYLNGCLFDAKHNIEFLKKSLRIVELRNDTIDREHINMIYLNLANNYLSLEDSNAAKYYFAKIKRFSESEMGSDFSKRFFFVASQYHFLTGQYDSALTYIEKSIQISQRNELYDDLIFSTLSYKAGILFRQLKTVDATEVYKGLLRLAKLRSDIDSSFISYTYFNIGCCYLEDQDYPMAIENCKLSLSYLTHKFGQERNYLYIYQLQAKLYFKEQNYEYALQCTDSALSYPIAIDPLNFVRLHLLRAYYYGILGKYKLVTDEDKVASKIVDEYNLNATLDIENKNILYTSLGQAYFFAFKFDSSLYYYNEMGADYFLPTNGFMSKGLFIHDEDLFALDLIHENRLKELSILIEVKDELSDIDTLVRYIYNSIHFFKNRNFNAFQTSQDELLDYYKNYVSVRPIYFEYIKLYYKVMIPYSLEATDRDWFYQLKASYDLIDNEADGTHEIFLAINFARNNLNKEALSQISRAARKGYFDYNFLEHCKYFEQIREEDNFQKSLAKAKLNYGHIFSTAY